MRRTPIAAPVRVLHVLGTLERGGVETWLLDLLEGLDRGRWQMDFLTLGEPGSLAPVARARGARVLCCRLGAPGFLLRLGRLLRGEGCRIVHSHVHRFSAVVLGVARMAGVPVRIAHSHNTADGRPDTWTRALYRTGTSWLLDRVRSSGMACSAQAAEALFGPRSPSAVVHYGLNGSLEAAVAAAGDRLRLRREFALPPEAPVVGHVGRFDPQKNHEGLLDVAGALAQRMPEARWVLVGEGPGRERIERRARAMGLESRIRFAGRRDDVPCLMRSLFDAFLFPSLHEGLPLALLEAQAGGLRSLVSSRVSGEAAVVRGAVEFLPLETPAGIWAERLAALLLRPRLELDPARRELRAAGFSIGESRRRLLEIYQEALACHGGAP